jgi:hypothetical protein
MTRIAFRLLEKTSVFSWDISIVLPPYWRKDAPLHASFE